MKNYYYRLMLHTMEQSPTGKYSFLCDFRCFIFKFMEHCNCFYGGFCECKIRNDINANLYIIKRITCQ